MCKSETIGHLSEQHLTRTFRRYGKKRKKKNVLSINLPLLKLKEYTCTLANKGKVFVSSDARLTLNLGYLVPLSSTNNSWNESLCNSQMGIFQYSDFHKLAIMERINPYVDPEIPS